MGWAAPTVHRWPAEAQQLLAEPSLLIATVDTAKTAKRETVRQLVRRAAGEILALRLPGRAAPIQLLSKPGLPLRLAPPDQSIGISFSHEAGCSLIAINLNGPIGADLLQTPENPAWQREILSLANDYLGPEIAAQLARQSVPEQARHFATAWTQHEARLKCLGLALCEWTPDLQQILGACRAQSLMLARDYFGAIAI